VHYAEYFSNELLGLQDYMADGSYFIFSQCIFFTTTAAAAAGAEKASKRAEMSHLALKG
jgi:hypothetical protein